MWWSFTTGFVDEQGAPRGLGRFQSAQNVSWSDPNYRVKWGKNTTKYGRPSRFSFCTWITFQIPIDLGLIMANRVAPLERVITPCSLLSAPAPLKKMYPQIQLPTLQISAPTTTPTGSWATRFLPGQERLSLPQRKINTCHKTVGLDSRILCLFLEYQRL